MKYISEVLEPEMFNSMSISLTSSLFRSNRDTYIHLLEKLKGELKEGCCDFLLDVDNRLENEILSDGEE
jgi:hypothetical protein